MRINGFENLYVWQKGRTLAISVYHLTGEFPKEELYGLTAQIRRSSTSICANIAEGYKRSRKDFVRYLDISHGSLEETKSHLLISKDLGYCKLEAINSVYSQIDEIGRMLTGLKQKLRSSR